MEIQAERDRTYSTLVKLEILSSKQTKSQPSAAVETSVGGTSLNNQNEGELLINDGEPHV